MTRREAREQALCLIFEKTFLGEPLSEVIERAKEARELAPDPFAERLADGVFSHLPELDAKIERYSIGWNKSRLSRVVLSILRLTLFEMEYLDDIPLSVSINEAVELAKRYAGDGDASFINGVLGAVARAPEAGEDASTEDVPEDTPKGDAPGENIPKGDAPEENIPAKDTPKENAPKKDAPGEDAPACGTPVEDVPASEPSEPAERE